MSAVSVAALVGEEREEEEAADCDEVDEAGLEAEVAMAAHTTQMSTVDVALGVLTNTGKGEIWGIWLLVCL